MSPGRDAASAVFPIVCASAISQTSCEKPVVSDAQSRKVERKPCTVTFAFIRRSSIGIAIVDSGFLGLGPGKRSEEHTSELQSLMRISYAVFCLKKNTINKYHIYIDNPQLTKNR